MLWLIFIGYLLMGLVAAVIARLSSYYATFKTADITLETWQPSSDDRMLIGLSGALWPVMLIVCIIYGIFHCLGLVVNKIAIKVGDFFFPPEKK